MNADKDARRPVGDDYVLETGDKGASRLQLLQEVYGPATERVCRANGLKPGWKVADIGCGTGPVTCWLAKEVGPTGAVTGVDVSPDQLALARERAARAGLSNVGFVESSAYDIALPTGTFDMVFCRLLLCHLQRPLDAIRQMARLVRPGGVLVAQDLNHDSILTDPPSEAYARFLQLVEKVGASLGVDYCLGTKLHRLFREAGLKDVEVTFDQPVFTEGEKKRVWEYTWLEIRPRVIAGGLTSETEFDALAREAAAIGTDTTTMIAQACLPTVRGVKAASRG